MKRIFAIYFLLSPVLLLTAQSSLTVEIVDLENNKGTVIVALLDKHEKDVKHDQYAIRFFHENQNEELDTNFLGIPKEGFGFSNDAMGKFGPKDFSEWLFAVSGDTKVKLTANYLF